VVVNASAAASRLATVGGWAFPLGVGALLVVWSLLAWSGWLLVGVGGALLDAGSGWLASWPELLYWARAGMALLESAGAVLIGIAWAVGAIGIVFGAWLGRRLWRAALQALQATAAMPATDRDPSRTVHPALQDGRRPTAD
jgi:hypothetical protein